MKEGRPHRLLPDKTLFMMFFDKSTRTRNSMEAGITQLGGHAHLPDRGHDAGPPTVRARRTPASSSPLYGHGIAIRHDLIPGEGNTLHARDRPVVRAPVLNLQCDINHPCQTLADLMTLRERFFGGDLRGTRRSR